MCDRAKVVPYVLAFITVVLHIWVFSVAIVFWRFYEIDALIWFFN